MADPPSTLPSESAEELGHRIQESLQAIVTGLDGRQALSTPELEDLRRDLRMLVHRERLQITTGVIDKAEQVLSYMLRPNIEECLNLWFGKSEQTDQEIWNRFGADVALGCKGHYDYWALDDEHPRLLVALAILLDQFPRNMYRGTPQMYARDPHCLALVKSGLRIGAGRHLRPIERVFLCLVLTHSEALDDQHLCMAEWDRVMEELAPDDPLNAFHEIFHRHVAVIQRFGRFPHRNKILQRPNTEAEERFLADGSFRFDLPLVRRPNGAFAFAGAVKRTVKLLDHEYETLLPEGDAMPRGAIAFKYAADEGFTNKAREQLEKQGFIRIGDNVPDFTAESSMGSIKFHEFIGDSWCVLFSHPADFTPVCTTEFGATARLKPEWGRRGVKVVGLSVDSAEDHARWITDINETQNARVDFPIIADKDRRISMLFGMLDATTFRHGAASPGATMTVRSVFIISPSKRVELILSYPAFVGRNFDEILRVVDALQLSAKYQVATPANWAPGDDTVVLPFISDEEAERIFGAESGFRKVRSYLRYVRDPSLRSLFVSQPDAGYASREGRD